MMCIHIVQSAILGSCPPHNTYMYVTCIPHYNEKLPVCEPPPTPTPHTHTQLCLQYYESEFVELACQCPAVICCRCSPTHKAQVVSLLRNHTHKPVCAVGDGGNDVSMIQAANVGVGIVGKEGKQASLAADFSVTQFSHISRLLVWHGRNR